MGFGDFIMKHGPGSPGSIAKAVTKSYLKFQRQFPNASKIELLELTLAGRMKTHEIIGRKFISIEDRDMILRKIEGKLYRLIVYIDCFENPDSRKTYQEFPDLFIKAKSIMKEVMQKYAPGVE